MTFLLSWTAFSCFMLGPERVPEGPALPPELVRARAGAESHQEVRQAPPPQLSVDPSEPTKDELPMRIPRREAGVLVTALGAMTLVGSTAATIGLLVVTRCRNPAGCQDSPDAVGDLALVSAIPGPILGSVALGVGGGLMGLGDAQNPPASRRARTHARRWRVAGPVMMGAGLVASIGVSLALWDVADCTECIALVQGGGNLFAVGLAGTAYGYTFRRNLRALAMAPMLAPGAAGVAVRFRL